MIKALDLRVSTSAEILVLRAIDSPQLGSRGFDIRFLGDPTLSEPQSRQRQLPHSL